jgi:hypothetical protein
MTLSNASSSNKSSFDDSQIQVGTHSVASTQDKLWVEFLYFFSVNSKLINGYWQKK